MNKPKNQKKKNNKSNFWKTLKPILIFSFIINIILITYVYYLKTANHTYIFSATDDYLSIDSGVINLNYNVNLLEGNGIKYINKEDYKIKELRIGYYLKEGDNLIELISYKNTYSEKTSLKESIENISDFNIWGQNEVFKNLKKDLLEKEIYIVLEAKTEDNEQIIDKLELSISKLH